LTGHTAAVNVLVKLNQQIITGSADGHLHIYLIPDQIPDQLQVIKPTKKYHDHDGVITAMSCND